jgi:hypothetical protein
MNEPIFYVGGSKGGVGKSLVSFALTDHLLGRGGSVLLLDTDTDNPDVYKAHKGLQVPDLICGLNSLDDADGWSEMLTAVEANPARAVVINSAARSRGGILKVEGGRMWKWAFGCILGSVLTIGCLCCGAYYKGNSAGVIVGRQYGYDLAKDEKAAADWANTPQGKTARHFARYADIWEFARCDRKEWKKTTAENTGKLACFPQSKTSGWHIPPENDLPLQNYPLPPTLQKR